jgi:tetratricopeptide (TPR) repeat protein
MFILRSQILGTLSQIAVERGNLEVALDFADRAVNKAREGCLSHAVVAKQMIFALDSEAAILESLGRLDEALALDAEVSALNPGESPSYEALQRRAIKHMAAGENAEAERLLRVCTHDMPDVWDDHHTSKTIEAVLKPHTVLAELLEGRGTEETLAEARTLRDGVAQQLAKYEARRAAAWEETRVATAKAVRQWRGERIKGRKVGGKGKGKGKKSGKKKGRKGQLKAKAKGVSPAAVIEGGPPREPAGGEAEGAATVEGAAAAEAEAPVRESHQPVEEEEEEEEQQQQQQQQREECAVCLQDLELEDDEDTWGDEGGEGEALVVLRCGHRFHQICGDMWCAKCADKGWGVTRPGLPSTVCGTAEIGSALPAGR